MKKFFVFLLSLTISLTPTFLWAGAAEKWEIIENVYDTSKKTVHIEAKRITQAAANSGKFVVDVPVSPSTLGSTLKTMMWTGVAVAGVEALLQGIGWVIDKDAQSIWRYKKQDDSYNIPPALNEYEYYAVYSGNVGATAPLAQRISEWETAFKVRQGGSFAYDKVVITGYNFTDPRAVTIYYDAYFCTSNCSPSSAYTYGDPKRTGNVTIYGVYVGPPQNLEKEYLSDTDLGNEVMGQGENTVPEGGAIATAYNPNNPVDAPAPKQSDDALESSNPQPDTDTSVDSSPKPNVDTDGDGVPDEHSASAPSAGDKITIPAACDWFPAACDFFLVQKADNKEIKQNQKDQIQQDKDFFEKVQDWFDWSQEQPDLDQDEIDIQEPDEFDTSVFSTDRFSVSRQCPVPESHTIALSGVSVDFSFDLSPLCQVLEFARPALVACSYLYAAYIVIGAARNG